MLAKLSIFPLLVLIGVTAILVRPDDSRAGDLCVSEHTYAFTGSYYVDLTKWGFSSTGVCSGSSQKLYAFVVESSYAGGAYHYSDIIGFHFARTWHCGSLWYYTSFMEYSTNQAYTQSQWTSR